MCCGDRLNPHTNKDAQLKWYLHFRRNLIEKNQYGVKECNLEIMNIILRILREETPAPLSFSLAWFTQVLSKNTQQQIESGNVVKPKFASFIAKNAKGSRAETLLSQKFSEEIQIPSIHVKDYY